MIELYCETCDELVEVVGYFHKGEDGGPDAEVSDAGDHEGHDLAVPTTRRPAYVMTDDDHKAALYEEAKAERRATSGTE